MDGNDLPGTTQLTLRSPLSWLSLIISLAVFCTVSDYPTRLDNSH